MLAQISPWIREVAGMPWVRQLAAWVILLLGVLLVYLLISRMLSSLARRKSMSTQLVVVLRSVSRWLAVVVLLLLSLQVLGVLENVWAVIVTVVGMVAIGFVAVWSVLSNAMCTLFLLIFQPFRIGDEVQIPADDISGKAVDLNFMYTTLETEDGYQVRIPNNTFFQKAVRRKAGQKRISLGEQLHQRMNDA